MKESTLNNPENKDETEIVKNTAECVITVKRKTEKTVQNCHDI